MAKRIGRSNLVGKTFGYREVLEYDEKSRDTGASRCVCGKISSVSSGSLREATNCGCLKIKDLTDRRFGKLVAIKRVYTDNAYGVHWLCHCDCGNDKIQIVERVPILTQIINRVDINNKES